MNRPNSDRERKYRHGAPAAKPTRELGYNGDPLMLKLQRDVEVILRGISDPLPTIEGKLAYVTKYSIVVESKKHEHILMKENILDVVTRKG